MIAHHFGPTIDIHGGGVDLQFPHHENECAQSRCAHDAPLARYWLHNGMLNMAGEKMSKSRGNIKLVDELLADYPGEAVRLALLQGHYRQPLISLPTYWTNPCAVLTGSIRCFARMAILRPRRKQRPMPSCRLCAMILNTPKAMAELFALAKHADTPDGKGQLLAAPHFGLLQADPEVWFASDWKVLMLRALTN